MFDFEGDAVGPLVMSFYVKYSRATHNIKPQKRLHKPL